MSRCAPPAALRHNLFPAATHPQVLPLLEFALEELYKRQSVRRDGLLRWEDYLAFGGIEGVIAAKADGAVGSAGAGAGLDQAVNAVLSALVGIRTDRGEATVPIRRRSQHRTPPVPRHPPPVTRYPRPCFICGILP